MSPATPRVSRSQKARLTDRTVESESTFFFVDGENVGERDEWDFYEFVVYVDTQIGLTRDSAI